MCNKIRIKEIDAIDEDKPTMYSDAGYDTYTEVIRCISGAYDGIIELKVKFDLSAIEKVRMDIAMNALRQASDIIGDLDVSF